MLRNLLIISSIAVGVSASAEYQNVNSPKMDTPKEAYAISKSDLMRVEASINDGTARTKQKVVSTAVSWKRPAGQFWGTGFAPSLDGGFSYFPLILRPWVNYTFENQSTVSKGSPTWNVEYYDPSKDDIVEDTFSQENLDWSYLRYENVTAPILHYKGQTDYPSIYYKTSLEGNAELIVNNAPSFRYLMEDKSIGTTSMVVCSHFFSGRTRNSSDSPGLSYYSGATGYPDGPSDGGDTSQSGMWFGSNARGINAQATRYEKPLQPYLLNSVHWYYTAEGTITNDITLKCYVFKTEDPAKEYTFTTSDGREVTQEILELGDLIAVSEAVVPLGEAEGGFINFEFLKTNPVTGASTAVSLEIEDDITIVVAGYDVNPGPDTYISGLISADLYDEGYGNLGFLGQLEENEDGTISYGLTAISDFFVDAMPKTAFGILADVTYPWMINAYINPENDVKLPNDGETTETVQGLQYLLPLMSTSESSEFDVTYNGEEECDWLTITDVEDEYETNDEGEEEFTGEVYLLFEAAPNPDDVKRTCVVKLSIPAASYEITFRQGTGNDPVSVEVVEAEGNAQYFDLAGRRVMNPEKGLYIKVNGNKAEKVIR